MRTLASSPDQIAMREADAFLRVQDPVDVAAMQWHSRREQGLSAAQEAGLQQWLAADPAHEKALARLELGLCELRQLPRERTAHLRHTAPLAAAPPRRRWKGPGAWLSAAFSVRALALCCVALLCAGVGWQWWLKQPTFEHVYTAHRGQRLDIQLPDGSQLTLDSDSLLDVAIYRDRRVTRLPRGQAMFVVARDPSRPFTVQAGAAEVTVLGTRFSVRCKACELAQGMVEVEVEQGHVRVAQAGTDGAVELHAAQAVQLSAAGLGAVKQINPASVAAWRKGLLRFTSTPLAEAVREFERYAAVNLVISDPEVAAMPVGGSYQAANPAAFAQVLPLILPVRLVARADGKTEVVKKN